MMWTTFAWTGSMASDGISATQKARLCSFFFSSRRRHTRFDCDWSSDVCSSDLSIAIDVAATTLKGTDGLYRLACEGRDLSSEAMIGMIEGWANDFPVASVEDGRSEERRVGKECRSRWSPYH